MLSSMSVRPLYLKSALSIHFQVGTCTGRPLLGLAPVAAASGLNQCSPSGKRISWVTTREKKTEVDFTEYNF